VTTVADWLGEREPAPPAALLRRLRDALGTDAGRDAGEAAEVCLAAGERLLAVVLREDETSRDDALDLLAADALVTYAFEAASVAPNALSERAARAITSIASLGTATPMDESAGLA
jgi:hypothetical protein